MQEPMGPSEQVTSAPAPALAPGQAGGGTQGAAWQPAEGGPPPPPSVSLPTGGGAIRDIGEKFTVNPATGTASLAIPVATSPGRAGFGPSLSLTYDSGAGRPVRAGLGRSLPAITRKTDKGLPRYEDDPDQDTFILSGTEDLVPVRAEHDGAWVQVPQRRSVGGRRYEIQQYRPRVESLFARIERWRDLGSGETHWRSISSGNVTTHYGATPDSRIADPADPARVFSWLICESHDDTGNAAVYETWPRPAWSFDRAAQSATAPRSPGPPTATRNGSGTATRPRGRPPQAPPIASMTPNGPIGTAAAGCSRSSLTTATTTSTPRSPNPPGRGRAAPTRSPPTGRASRSAPTGGASASWCSTTSPASRTSASAAWCSTDLTYREAGGSGMTTVASAVQTGYRRRPGGYRAESLPPLEFGYSEAVIDESRDLGPEVRQNLPAGIDGSAYQWVDLDGEGLSGILARQGGAWFYKANLGDGRFAPERILAAQPAMAGAGGQGHQQLLDLAGDGHLDLAELGGDCHRLLRADPRARVAAVPAVPVAAAHLVGRP